MADKQLFLQATVQIDGTEAETEQLIAMLAAVGFDAFEEQAEVVVASAPVGVVDTALVADLLETAGWKYDLQQIENQNWNAAWESSFEPVMVDDFAAVRATFHAPVQGVRHELIITPKMSFGTGHHETTWLMIKGMEQLDLAGKQVIDFGAGTGVLSILAEKLGAAAVLAVECDSWSVENANENVAVNDCSRVEVLAADYLPEGRSCQVLLANINRHILLEHLPAMWAATQPGGRWLLSGLLAENEDEMRQRCTELGLHWRHTNHRNGWISMLFDR